MGPNSVLIDVLFWHVPTGISLVADRSTTNSLFKSFSMTLNSVNTWPEGGGGGVERANTGASIDRMAWSFMTVNNVPTPLAGLAASTSYRLDMAAPENPTEATSMPVPHAVAPGLRHKPFLLFSKVHEPLGAAMVENIGAIRLSPFTTLELYSAFQRLSTTCNSMSAAKAAMPSKDEARPLMQRCLDLLDMAASTASALYHVRVHHSRPRVNGQLATDVGGWFHEWSFHQNQDGVGGLESFKSWLGFRTVFHSLRLPMQPASLLASRSGPAFLDTLWAFLGGMKGSLGGEVYYSLRERVGNLSLGAAFSFLVPDKREGEGEGEGEAGGGGVGHLDPTSLAALPTRVRETILSLTMNPFMGHLSTTFYVALSSMLELAGIYEFNCFSLESDMSLALSLSKRVLSSSHATSNACPTSDSSSQADVSTVGGGVKLGPMAQTILTLTQDTCFKVCASFSKGISCLYAIDLTPFHRLNFGIMYPLSFCMSSQSVPVDALFLPPSLGLGLEFQS